jgi:hypothetical protein
MKKRWRDWPKLAYPYLDPATSVLDAVIQRAKSDGVDLVMVSGTPPPADSEFVHQSSGVTEVNFDSRAIESHIAGMDHEIGMLVGDPRREQRPVVGEMWLVLAQMRVGNLNKSH